MPASGSPERSDRAVALINDLLAASAETASVEFKENNSAPVLIGKYISALANAAALEEEHFGYLVWGVRDSDYTVIGTTFDPHSVVRNGQPLPFWLAQRIAPDGAFRFQTVAHPAGRVVLLTIPAATASPVDFDRTAYLRIGSATPRLADYPDRQRALWRKLQPFLWETGIAASFLTEDEVLARIDYPSYFDLTDQPLPNSRHGIVQRLSEDRIIFPDAGGRWNITHLGAILFAKRLDQFDSSIARKAVRFTSYDGPSRADTVVHRYDEPRGYGAGFVSIVDYVDRLIPKREQIGKAFRTEHPKFPPVAIRELIANALIHQDMTITGAGPSVELCSNRLEITNPGSPLISPNRFIDAPPRSRNEALAAFMRRMKLCEEQGTGIDKVVAAVERRQMPPPDFQVGNGRIEATRAILFAPVGFADMMIQERLRACYQHAALKFIERGVLTNTSLRQRFGLTGRDSAKVSQVIRLARDRGQIKPADPTQLRSGYVPFWA